MHFLTSFSGLQKFDYLLGSTLGLSVAYQIHSKCMSYFIGVSLKIHQFVKFNYFEALNLEDPLAYVL